MNWSEIQKHYHDIRHRLAQQLDLELLDNDERGAFLEALRRFKNREEGLLEQSELKGLITLEELLVSLTALAETCLEGAFRYETRYMERRYGMADTAFHIIGMGKFGGYEITLHSDLDLIFIFDRSGTASGEQSITHQEYFVRLVQRLISSLSLRTRYGRVYEIDTELRPSGRAGVLVSSWSAFAEYHRKDARTWEKQSLIRGRPVLESEASKSQMSERLAQLIWCREYDAKIASEMHHLRRRMERELAKETDAQYNLKVGVGGIVDIEFIVQYLQLRYGRQHPAIMVPHTLSALKLLASHQYLPAASAQGLAEAYLFYRKIETRLRSLAERSADLLPRQESEETDQLLHKMDESSWKQLVDRYEAYRQQVRKGYLKILELEAADDSL